MIWVLGFIYFHMALSSVRTQSYALASTGQGCQPMGTTDKSPVAKGENFFHKGQPFKHWTEKLLTLAVEIFLCDYCEYQKIDVQTIVWRYASTVNTAGDRNIVKSSDCAHGFGIPESCPDHLTVRHLPPGPDHSVQRFARPPTSTETCIVCRISYEIGRCCTCWNSSKFRNLSRFPLGNCSSFHILSSSQPAACPLIQWHPGRKRSFLHLTTNTNWQRTKQVANQTLRLNGVENIIFGKIQARSGNVFLVKPLYHILMIWLLCRTKRNS